MSAEWAWLLAVIPACAFIVLALFGRSLPRQGDWLGVLTVTSLLGLLIAVFQTLTSIQEMTLTFVPKIIIIFGSVIVFMPFMITSILEFTRSLYDRIAALS